MDYSNDYILEIQSLVRILHTVGEQSKTRFICVLNKIAQSKLAHFQQLEEDYAIIVRREKKWDTQL
jgi:GTP1/Obg family GTP-binding protein